MGFLESMSDKDVIVAFLPPEQHHREHHITIVGDWFIAEAAYAHTDVGIRQTIFTRYAPSIRSRIETFDEEIALLLDESGILPENSRKYALIEIQKILKMEINAVLNNQPDIPKGDKEKLVRLLENFS